MADALSSGPFVPGAINLTTLTGDEIIPVATTGTRTAQTTVDVIAAFAQAGLNLPLDIDEGGTGAPTASEAFDNLKQSATVSATGVVKLATNAEAVTGTDTTSAVTPAGLTARMAAPGIIGGTTPAAVTGTTITAATSDTPLRANSLNSNVAKIALFDNGTLRAYLGANSTYVLAALTTDTAALGFGVVNAASVNRSVQTTPSNGGNPSLTVTGGKLNIGSALNLSAIPTSASGLSSGDVWNDGGTLKIVT